MQQGAYDRRQTRAMVRELKLRELGYDSYDDYLRSPAWRDVRRRYRESDLPQVCMCGSVNVQLHHTTYERVGREELEDLLPLCQDCHATAHALEAAGAIDLDLAGFYYSAERAARNAEAAAERLERVGGVFVEPRDRRRAKKKARALQLRQRRS